MAPDRPDRPPDPDEEKTFAPGSDPVDTFAPTFAPESEVAAPGEPLDPIDSIGPYRIRDVLGEGGMGTVYLAEQVEPVRRKVALKIIKLGMDTREVIARFESERQALAIMNHPSVAKVLDGGVTERGRPYFVMEFVAGVPITDYCDRYRLSLPERLELFIRVCEAIQHAHQKGIIHRDIKPSNVLVSDEEGQHVPKVIDFGIAKATGGGLTEKTLHTQRGVLIGTPAYMSPEQAEATLDVDTRTDVYSLGVLLYELVVGVLPFDPKQAKHQSIEEIRRKILDEDPPRPSTRVTTLGDASSAAAEGRRTDPGSLRKQLSGDLDWIVMKSLEKDRNRRYETANGLAMDIRRYLGNEPVVARPPSTTYKLSKFVRRNKGGVLAAAVMIVAILVGLTLATVGFVQARRERDRAMAAEALARSEADKATATNEFLTNMLSSARPAKAQGREITVRELLDEASKTVGESFARQPEVEAAVRVTIGAAYDSLAVFDAAESHLSRALEIRRDTLGDDHVDTAGAMNQMAVLHFHRGDYDAAERLYVQELETLRRALGEEHPSVLTAMQNLGAVNLRQKRYAQAEEILERTLEGRRRVLGDEHPDTMATIANLALAYDWQDRDADAEPLLEQVLEHRRRVLGERHPRTLISMFNLGRNYESQRRWNEAEPLYVAAFDGFREVNGEDHPYTLKAAKGRTGLLILLERFEEAETVGLDCYARHEGRYGAGHAQTRQVAALLARLYETSGQPGRAAEWAARSGG